MPSMMPLLNSTTSDSSVACAECHALTHESEECQAATEKRYRLGKLAVLAEQHVLLATRSEGGEVRHVQGDATKPKLSGAHNIVAHVCSDVGSFGAGFA